MFVCDSNTCCGRLQRHGDLQARGSAFPEFCEFGFYALPGWDAVSGLGTPNWAQLQHFINDFVGARS